MGLWVIVVIIWCIVIESPMPLVGLIVAYLVVNIVFDFLPSPRKIWQQRTKRRRELDHDRTRAKYAERLTLPDNVWLRRDDHGRWRDTRGRYATGPKTDTNRVVVAGRDEWESIFGVLDRNESVISKCQSYSVGGSSIKLHQPTPPPTHGTCKGCGLDAMFDQRMPFACLCEVCVDVQLAREHNLKTWGAVA